MIKTLVHALQHRKSFQMQLQAQSQPSDPDLDALCSCCLDSVIDNPDFTLIMEQLLDTSVQAGKWAFNQL